MNAVHAACTVAVVAALAEAVHAAADSTVPSPLKQLEAGAGTGDILCNAGLMLLVSPSGAPACVFAGSLDTLADRGWREGPVANDGPGLGQERGGLGIHAVVPGDEERHRTAPGPIASAPTPMDTHHNTLTISKYPVVGEVAEMTFAVTYATYESGAYSIDLPPARLVVGIDPAPPTHRIFDVVSNIGTGDTGVFRPYDPDNVTTIAQPGETYTVKAKFEVLEEGDVAVYGHGLHDDIAVIPMMVSKNMSMSHDDYEATGQTYLDNMGAAGQGEPTSPVFAPDIRLSVPAHSLNKTTLLEYHQIYSSFAEGYVALNYTEDQMVEEMFYWGYLRSDIREFFVHVMNYTEGRADEVRMGDDLLAAAYRSYWDNPTNVADIVADMLERRNYTAAEVRDFFRDHMFYTDDEVDALPIDDAVARLQGGAAGQQ